MRYEIGLAVVSIVRDPYVAAHLDGSGGWG